MGAIKISYYENTRLTGHDEYGFLRVVAKDGITIKQSSNYYPPVITLLGRVILNH